MTVGHHEPEPARRGAVRVVLRERIGQLVDGDLGFLLAVAADDRDRGADAGTAAGGRGGRVLGGDGGDRPAEQGQEDREGGQDSTHAVLLCLDRRRAAGRFHAGPHREGRRRQALRNHGVTVHPPIARHKPSPTQATGRLWDESMSHRVPAAASVCGDGAGLPVASVRAGTGGER